MPGIVTCLIWVAPVDRAGPLRHHARLRSSFLLGPLFCGAALLLFWSSGSILCPSLWVFGPEYLSGLLNNCPCLPLYPGHKVRIMQYNLGFSLKILGQINNYLESLLPTLLARALANKCVSIQITFTNHNLHQFKSSLACRALLDNLLVVHSRYS